MKSHSAKEGFTLLEVMIAMAILAMSLTILLGAVNSGVIYSGNQRDVTIASFLAQSKMTELERKRELLSANSEDSGTFEGEFERFSWRYVITLDTGIEQLGDLADLNVPFEPMKVEVTVSWKDGAKEKSFVLQEMMFPIVSTTSGGR